MRVLITGICGFVGSALARGLREGWPDWEIVGLDSLVRAGSEINRRALREFGVKLYHGDIRSPSDLEAVPRCDWIIEAAANPSVLAGVDGKTSSRQLIEHNLVGTINVLELLKQWRCGFTLLSTSRVYSIRALASIPVEVRGDHYVPCAEAPRSTPARIPAFSPKGIAEDFSTEPPLSLYGTSKRAAELLACEYAESFDLPVSILRCGVLAGAGQFGKIDQGIFSYWIHSWRGKNPLKYIGFNGSGHQVRDCLHARDLVPLVVRQIESPSPEAPRVLNVSGGLSQSASLRQLSDWCARRFGPQSIAAEPKNRPFDIPWLVLDSTRVTEVWGWRPQTTLEAIWVEIAEHAEKNPTWLDGTAD
ncbi:MAG: NAD-dependent epimerase/dehydratase family protein [Verrucomicrobia bacterium]|nr:NAD-dependent epimerase/dehydratase family protein [Verrucomicrobiota bacterium]